MQIELKSHRDFVTECKSGFWTLYESWEANKYQEGSGVGFVHSKNSTDSLHQQADSREQYRETR